MKITPEKVQYIANLANLKLSEEDTSRYAQDMAKILEYVEQLNELDTRDVEPMAQILHSGNQEQLREDRPGTSLKQEDALRCAPSTGAGYFKVPKVIVR